MYSGNFLLVLLFTCCYMLMTADSNLKSQLSREFEMKDLGATKKILGMEIRTYRRAGKLYLS